MSAEVGGELEAVPTQRSLFGPDYGRLIVLVLVAVAVHAWLIANTAIPARDSLGYARIALNFSNPNGGETNPHEQHQRIDVIRSAEQPPGYPLAIWVTEKVLRVVTDLPLADRSLLATQVANATAAVLLVIPMYLIGRMLFGRNIGFAGALLFQVLPVPARVTSDGLSEGLYLLAASIAIMLGVRAGRTTGNRRLPVVWACRSDRPIWSVPKVCSSASPLAWSSSLLASTRTLAARHGPWPIDGLVRRHRQ